MRSIPIKAWILSIAALASLALVQIVKISSFEFSELNSLYRWTLLAFVTFPLLLLLHKTVMVDQVKKWMYANSEEIESELPSVFDSPERPAPVKPKILEFDMDSPFRHIEQREKIVHQAFVVLKRRWSTGSIACLVYISLTYLMGLFSGKKFGNSWFFVMVIVAIYFLLISLSYFVNQLDFRPKDESFGTFLPQFRALVIVTKILLNPQLDILLWLIFGGMLISGTFPWNEGSIAPSPVLFFLGVCISVAIHFGLLVKNWRAPHEGPNIKLLVLRVFGSSWAAVLTFDKLVRYWRKFGLHFTIDDPEFARHRNRFFQLRTLIELSAYTILVLINVWMALGVFLAGVGFDWFELLKRRPVLSQEHARQRIQKTLARPRYMDGTFRDLRMSAFMNTWKLVVDEFVNVADVVLFDLREYSEKRTGSQYEVDFLFDTFPVYRIVFLIRKNSDKEAIHRMILNSWAAMREGSPNMSIKDPVIRIYVNNKQNAPEVQGLMDLLLTAADTA